MREVERKFEVHGLFALPDLRGADAQGGTTGVAHCVLVGTMQLTSTYYDTQDLRLARDRITLRHRAGGVDDGWHLKLPLPRGAREEIHAAGLDGLADLVLATTRGAPLAPVAVLATRRTAFRLLDEASTEVAELVDDEVSVLAGEHVVARWRELEVELRDGDEGVLDRVGERLVAAGAQPAASPSKLARSLGTRAAAAPDLPPPTPVTPDDPVRSLVVAALRRYGRAFVEHDPAVRRDLPDAVHQMRVAARRLRSTVRTFAPLLQPEPAAALSGELRWIAGTLGPVRDTEVLLARLENHLAELPPGLVLGPVADHLERRLTGDMQRARERLLEAMRSPRYVALLDALVAAAADPPTTDEADAPVAQAVPPLVRAVYDKLEKAVASLDDDSPEEQVHAVRIRAKRARYAAETAALAYGAPAKDLAAQLARVTDLLGDYQDAAVAADVLRRIATEPGTTPGVAFTLGVLHARQTADHDRLRAEFSTLWPQVHRRRHRRWLEQ
ncbi:MAG: CHAD domain-containing protein [Mycobacterium leprae]